MKNFKKCAILIAITVFAFSFASCGSKNSPAKESEAPTPELTVAATPAPDVAEQTAPEADIKVAEDSFVGNWKDVNSGEGFVKITKTESGYQYEDNDGKYKATFEDGILKVQVSDDATDMADAYINSETGHLILNYQGGLSEYIKDKS